MRILIVAATPFEIAPFQQFLEAEYKTQDGYTFSKQEVVIKLICTGVGIAMTTYCMTKILSSFRFDLVIQVGLAGAYNNKLKLGEVVNIISERFADLGVEEADGSFTDVFELGLADRDSPPFRQGELIHPISTEISFLPKVKGLTVNKVHGFTGSIEKIKVKYAADVESMEGAAFFLVCLLEDVDFLQIRSISNYVEERNKENWDIPLAIENLNETLLELVESFGELQTKE